LYVFCGCGFGWFIVVCFVVLYCYGCVGVLMDDRCVCCFLVLVERVHWNGDGGFVGDYD